MKGQAVQIESRYACETCGGEGVVGARAEGCNHSQPCPCGSAEVECPDCYAGAVPCERCFDHPAKHTDRYEFAFEWVEEKICDVCQRAVENGPSDSDDGEAWWGGANEMRWQQEQARRLK